MPLIFTFNQSLGLIHFWWPDRKTLGLLSFALAASKKYHIFIMFVNSCTNRTDIELVSNIFVSSGVNSFFYLLVTIQVQATYRRSLNVLLCVCVFVRVRSRLPFTICQISASFHEYDCSLVFQVCVSVL
jgi:hypothetical protein